MKNIFLLCTIINVFFIMSCSNSDDNPVGSSNPISTGNTNPAANNFDYQIKITSPNKIAKNIDESITIEIEFKSNTGKVVHYIEIRIYNKSNNKEIYKEPSNNHVDDSSGLYNFNDNFVLSENNGVSVNTNWVLEAKVWGTNANEADVIKTLEFQVK